jgi:hypothetical protein
MLVDMKEKSKRFLKPHDSARRDLIAESPPKLLFLPPLKATHCIAFSSSFFLPARSLCNIETFFLSLPAT